MDTLERIGAQLDAVILESRAELQARAARLDQREADLARAMEAASQDAAAQAAYRHGREDERLRVRQLIGMQLQHLAPTSPMRSILHHLSRQVWEVEE